MGRLDGRTALVTGGASGLGKAIAARLADEGADVVITDVQADLGRSAAAGLGVTFLDQDVTSEEQWPAVLGQVEERFGHLDILVNNAGIGGAADLVSPEDTRLADWKQIFSVNVDGVFLGCRAGIVAMRRSGGGSIVNMSSIAALLATPDSTAYGAAKAAVRQLTKSVAQHCAAEGLDIRCNSVHPGEVRTPLWEPYVAADGADARHHDRRIVSDAKSRVPLGDMPQPEDIAAGVAFLCSPDARFITGSELIVDGGLIHCDTFRPLADRAFRSCRAIASATYSRPSSLPGSMSTWPKKPCIWPSNRRCSTRTPAWTRRIAYSSPSSRSTSCSAVTMTAGASPDRKIACSGDASGWARADASGAYWSQNQIMVSRSSSSWLAGSV